MDWDYHMKVCRGMFPFFCNELGYVLELSYLLSVNVHKQEDILFYFCMNFDTSWSGLYAFRDAWDALPGTRMYKRERSSLFPFFTGH